MDLFLSVHLQKKYLLITLLINLLILFIWTLLERSLRSLVIKSLIDNIFVEGLGLRQIVFTYSSLKSWFLNANAYFSTPKDYGYFFQKSN